MKARLDTTEALRESYRDARELLEERKSIRDADRSEENPDEDDAEQEEPSASDVERRSVYGWSGLPDVLTRLGNNGAVLSTGFKPLDRFFRHGGIAAGRVVCIGGPPGVGKTTLLCQIASAVSPLVPVSALFLDEGIEPAAVKIAQQLGYDRDAAEKGDASVVLGLRERLEGTHLRLLETEDPGASLNRAFGLAVEIDARVRVVIADSAQTIKLTTDQEADPEDREAISAFMWGGRKLAQEFETVLLIAAQLNRPAYRSKKDAADLNPLAMFAGSRAIEHASDVAILLDQPDDENDVVRFRVARNRLGELGTFYAKLDRNRASFVQVDPAEAAGAAEAIEDQRRLQVLANARDKVCQILRAKPGSGTRELRELKGGSHALLDAALERLILDGKVRVESKGKAKLHFLRDE